MIYIYIFRNRISSFSIIQGKKRNNIKDEKEMHLHLSATEFQNSSQVGPDKALPFTPSHAGNIAREEGMSVHVDIQTKKRSNINCIIRTCFA